LKISSEYFCREEYTTYSIYSALARISLLPKSYREIFEKNSEEEYKLFWKQHLKSCVTKNVWFKTLLHTAFTKLFGVTFVLKLLERGEKRLL